MKIIPQTSAGIEIAGQDLRIAVLRTFAGKRRLIRMDVLPGFIGLTDEDKLSNLSTYFKKHKLTGLNIHLTVPGAWGVTRDLEFPAAVAAGDALRSAVALQVENLSPWGLDEIYWDFASEPAPKGVRTIVVHVGIVSHAVLDPWIALFRSARLALTGASLSSLSWAHGAAVLWGTERPVMVLAAEPNYVEGTLVRGDRIHAIHTPGSDAARMSSMSASQLLRAGRIDSPDDVRLVSHGASAQEAGLEPIQLPVDGARGAAGFGAISTALLGLVKSGFRLNLIPAPLRFQRNVLQYVPTYALVTLLVVLGGLAWIREPYQQSLYAQRLDDEGRRLSVEVRSVAEQETRLNAASDRLGALETLIRSRDANLETLRELRRTLPQGTWLSSYSSQDNVVMIAGYSESAASIQKLLEDSPVFRDVQFTASITRDAAGKDRFTIRASIEVRP